jgi:hypothetical protein
MNRDQIIKEHKQAIKSLNLDELKELFDDSDLTQDYERVVMAMPRKATLEQLREALALNLIEWVEYNHLSNEDLISATEYVVSYKKETK